MNALISSIRTGEKILSRIFLKQIFHQREHKKLFLFLAQQWRLTTEGKLENKLRTWAHGKKNSTQIPSYGEQGIINITKKYGQNTILTIPFPGKGKTMIYKSKYNHKKSQPFQLWKIGIPDELGWFNITSSKSPSNFLTVTKIGNWNELTMEIEGKICSA